MSNISVCEAMFAVSKSIYIIFKGMWDFMDSYDITVLLHNVYYDINAIKKTMKLMNSIKWTTKYQINNHIRKILIL